jgi:hypothetical protein
MATIKLIRINMVKLRLRESLGVTRGDVNAVSYDYLAQNPSKIKAFVSSLKRRWGHL